MNKIYVRIIDKQAKDKQISIKKIVFKEFFDSRTDIEITNKVTGHTGVVKVLNSTDDRLGGDIKDIIKRQKEIEINDILVIYKINNEFSLKLFSVGDKEYQFLNELVSVDQNKHAIIQSEVQEDDELKVVDTFNDALKNEFRQYIYFGAPGTGKSYQLKQDSELFGNKVKRVTFHSNSMYGHFVGAYKPFPVYNEDNSNSITYKFIPGPLITQLINAVMNPNSAYLLIIEEINRANVSAVFGDFFQLLDRDSNYISEYPIDISKDIEEYILKDVIPNIVDVNQKHVINKMLRNGLIFPSNLFIWATMNSADQGVQPMDTAFKRRWEQKYFNINNSFEPEIFEGYKKINIKYQGDTYVLSWNDLRLFINDRLTIIGVPEDKLMGPYFISKNILNSDNNKLTESIKNKVILYLFEDSAKHRRSEIFDISPEKMRYSEISKKFDEEGIEVFKGFDALITNLSKD